MKKKINKKSPWSWVPTVYFMEGLPASIIMLVMAIMYKNFGVDNSQITLYTGAFVLPWVIKPLWASLVDMIFTSRWWIYTMQTFVGILLIIMALALGSENFFVLTIVISWSIAFLSSSHDIAADGFYIKSLCPSQQSFFIGLQSVTYNLGKIFATGFLLMLSGFIYSKTGSYKISWAVCLTIAGGLSLFLGIYHRLVLPYDNTKKISLNEAWTNFIDVYKSFIKIKKLWLGLVFIFLFKFSESMVIAILPLFLIDSKTNGGLALTNTFTGFAYGTISPLAIILGGIVGGYYLYRTGFSKSIYLLFFLINAPHILYFLLAYFHITNHIVVVLCILIEQFSFSIGLTATLLFGYFMVKDSPYKTAHYAFFTGVLFLGRMIPVMISGPIQESVGYTNFFVIVILAAIPTLIIIKKVKLMVGDYGLRKHS